jgi:hypothetical protein
VLLSGNVPYFDLFGFEYKLLATTINYMTTKINHDRTPLYLTYHRIDFPLPGPVMVGLSEANLTFADAHDLLNFNPIVFYHNIDRRSTNYLGGGDVVWEYKFFRLYGELQIDDILWEAIEEGAKSPTTIGYQLGGEVDSIPVVPGLSVLTEYTRIDRYMYERFKRNVRSDSLHFKVWRELPVSNCLGDPEVIGYWTGANSDNWYLQVRYTGIRHLTGLVTYDLIRKGEPDSKETLKGTLEVRHILRLGATYRLFDRIDLSAGYVFQRINNYGLLPGNKVNLQELQIKTRVHFLK